jgi:hypothetical protein
MAVAFVQGVHAQGVTHWVIAPLPHGFRHNDTISVGPFDVVVSDGAILAWTWFTTAQIWLP